MKLDGKKLPIIMHDALELINIHQTPPPFQLQSLHEPGTHDISL